MFRPSQPFPSLPLSTTKKFVKVKVCPHCN